jgi:hypothetical protein
MTIAERRERVAQMRVEGMSFDQIGVELGVAKRTAYLDAHALGLSTAAVRATARPRATVTRRTRRWRPASTRCVSRSLSRMLSPPPDDDRGWSARTLATALDKSLATTSHHTRALRDQGWFVAVGERRVRGTLQTFYRLSDAAIART